MDAREVRPPAEWKAALARVLERPDAILLYRQRIVDVKRHATAGFEVLARFRDEVVDEPPFRWFDAAYEVGCGPQLEAAVLRKALALLDEVPAGTFLSVNVDPSVLDDQAVVEVLLGRGRLDRLVVEITEVRPLGDARRLGDVTRAIREAGAFVAVDDTGTGFADLQRLLQVRPQFVKVDREFIAGIDQDPARRALVELMGHFASRIDAWVVAEGVERLEEYRTLAMLGVPLAQGFLLGRPEPEFRPMPKGVAEQLWVSARGFEDAGAAEPPVWPLIESVALVAKGEEVEGEIAVEPDRWGRPLAVWDGARWGSPLVVSGSSPVGETVRRALLRSPRERFQPIVVTNEHGTVLGVIPFDRLVEELARRVA